MNIVIIGAGASGVTAAINLKRKNPADNILLIEHLDKPLKKILATGNGKCNLGNAHINFSKFNNPDFAYNIIKDYSYQDFFDSISIKTKLLGDLAYPISESAVSVRDAMLLELRKFHIKLNVNEKLLNYNVGNKIEVITDKNKYIADKLILAGGLKSSSKLGSDGSVIEILEKHNYKITKVNPGLSPIITKEKTKDIDGVRVKANVSLFKNGELLAEETGEVLFKDHGLSGIVMFNMMSIISRNNNGNYKFKIDMLPDIHKKELDEYVKTHSFEETMLAFINPKITSYLKNRFKTNKEIIESIKALEFNFENSYGYDFSQVSVGGIDISQIENNMMSKLENNVYIIGELLDIDGPCGGYNLTWAFASALKL